MERPARGTSCLLSAASKSFDSIYGNLETEPALGSWSIGQRFYYNENNRRFRVDSHHRWKCSGFKTRGYRADGKPRRECLFAANSSCSGRGGSSTMLLEPATVCGNGRWCLSRCHGLGPRSMTRLLKSCCVAPARCLLSKPWTHQSSQVRDAGTRGHFSKFALRCANDAVQVFFLVGHWPVDCKNTLLGRTYLLWISLIAVSRFHRNVFLLFFVDVQNQTVPFVSFLVKTNANGKRRNITRLLRANKLQAACRLLMP